MLDAQSDRRSLTLLFIASSVISGCQGDRFGGTEVGSTIDPLVEEADPGTPINSKGDVPQEDLRKAPADFGSARGRVETWSRPQALSPEVLARRTANIEAEIDASRAHLEVVATTTTEDGTTFDWVVPESQVKDGVLPELPPPLWELLGRNKSDVITPRVEAIRAEIDRKMKGPPGTVPLYRENAEHIARYAESYAEFRHKTNKPASVCVGTPGFGQQCRYWSSTSQTGSFWGTAGFLNVWRPAVDQVNNAAPMSLMQFNTSAVGPDGLVETIEVGWQVDPVAYNGDTLSHLFVFLTNDGYGLPGSCYNAACTTLGGWVALSGTITAGMALTPSTFNGEQREALIGVSPIPGWYLVWWLDQWIGAVPAAFYDAAGMGSGITAVNWYGEVADNEKDGLATGTDMGGGAFPNAGWGQFAYIRDMNLQLRNADQSLGPWQTYFTVWPASGGSGATDSNCYGFSSGFDNTNTFWNSWVLLGGPGWNAPNCTSD